MDRYDVAILGAGHFQVGLYQNGAGYRYLELALTLQDLGVRVAVVCPGPTDFAGCPVPVLDQGALPPGELESCAGVYIFCLLEDEALVTRLKDQGRALVYDSFLTPVEQLTYPRVQALGDPARIDAHFHDVVGKHNRFNALADAFIVGEPEEALLKLGELISTFQVGVADYGTLSGRIRPLPVIAFSRHHRPPDGPPAAGKTFLWNGGLWNHYGGVDVLLDAVAGLRAAGADVECHFLYPDERMTAHQHIAGRLAAGVRLGVHGAAPDFFAKQPILAACRGLVLLFEPVLQLNLFLSMRLREALLFAKPLIVSDFGVLAAFVTRHGIGLTTPNTVDGVRSALLRLSTDEELYATLVGNLRALRDRYDMAVWVPPIAELVARYNGAAAG